MLKTNEIYNNDCLELMKTFPDNSIDLIITDPPYALGSKVIIRPDGKPDYKKAVDFMNKWNQPDGKFWEEWFIESMRILKHGGRIAMFGMDRQCMLNKYYASYTGFEEQQSLYWYNISGFPKAINLSKMIDKNSSENFEIINGIRADVNITAPATELSKKYDGYKYSISPLKQTNETIMIFQKPYKTGSCLHDTLAMENGDETITCGAFDIDENRIPHNEELKTTQRSNRNNASVLSDEMCGFDNTKNNIASASPNGRYPAQTFIDSEIAKILDEQSGVKSSCQSKTVHVEYGESFKFGGGISTPDNQYSDTGGCSRILHKCDYDKEDFDIYNYCPKVSKKERNEGLDELNEKAYTNMNKIGGSTSTFKTGSGNERNVYNKNNHPTVKPIALMTKIISLFKTPNKQIILDPFTGSGTTGIVCKNLGIDYILIEKEEEYFNIAKARIRNFKQNNEISENERTGLFSFS